jgi:4-diphosphocytidyl-2-C-methyl-D-erythritol kinase
VGKSVSIAAHAKLNLSLAVVGKRDDGYHELRSVFATIALSDDVRVAAHRRLEVRNTMRVDDEIAARAVVALASANGHEPHAFVRIRKRIPLAAGLGGGSSDAAAVLRGLATLWGLGGDRADAKVDLLKVAAGVGSDVPFFARAAPVALVSGRGEHVKPLRTPKGPVFAVVLRPTLRLATKDVFAAYRPEDTGAAAHVDAMASAFERGAVTPDLLRVHAANDLLAAATRRCEAIASWQATAAARGIALFLTGSGPTLFALADDRADALRVARILKRAGLRAHAHALFV